MLLLIFYMIRGETRFLNLGARANFKVTLKLFNKAFTVIKNHFETVYVLLCQCKR